LIFSAFMLPAPASAAPDSGPATGRHSSGLMVVAASPPRPSQMPESAARLLHDAETLAEQHPDDFGYAWYDEKSGEVTLTTTGDSGDRLAGAMPNGTSLSSTPRRFARVSYSWATLERIKNDAIMLSSTVVPDGDAIYRTARDRAHNRVLITVQRLSDGLLNALAARYGTSAIAIEYNPNRPVLTKTSRSENGSPFYGGASLNPSRCTSGFPWIAGSQTMMLTAGHCVPDGGPVNTARADDGFFEFMGTVQSGSEETWDVGVGTVPMTGQSGLHGDLALVRVASGKQSTPDMFRGGPDTSQVAAVMEMWSRRPATNDLFCTGGRITGEQCGWRVTECNLEIKYDDGTKLINGCEGVSRDNESIPGNSGGPVYTVRGDGGIAAKGIISGSGKFPAFPNSVFFTDIWDAFAFMPGILNTVYTNPQPRNATAVSQSNGIVDVFWKGTNRSLWHRRFSSGAWASPVQLVNAGVVGGLPTAAGQSNGIVDVFWKGTDGGLWHKWLSGGTWYGPVNMNAGQLGSDPVVVNTSPGIVDVFWRGTNGGLWHKWFSGGSWFGPAQLATSGLSGKPAVVGQSNGVVDVFWQGTDGGLWHQWFANGSWHGPQNMNSGVVGSDLAAVNSSPGVVHVFWKDLDLNLVHQWFNGTAWSGPENLGSGPVVEPPTVTAQSNGIVDVFWKGANGGLWHKWFSGPWFGPEGLGGSIT
jgi:hypothetical protein